MGYEITWTGRDGAPRGPRACYPGHAEAVREMGSALSRLDRGDVILLTEAGRVLLQLHCWKAASTGQGTGG